MTFQTITQIQITPDQLTELIRVAVRSELAIFTPPAPIGADLPKDTDAQLALRIPLKVAALNQSRCVMSTSEVGESRSV